MKPVFLALDEVLALHADQLERYGGSPGIRDIALLQSALAMPRATFEGSFLHSTLHEMAAAYLFHLVRNHPFVDGNKRTGLMTAIVFLGLNGLVLKSRPDELAKLVSGVAAGEVGKAEIAVFFKHHTRRAR